MAQSKKNTTCPDSESFVRRGPGPMIRQHFFRSNDQFILPGLFQQFWEKAPVQNWENKKCHSHVTNAPKGIGQA